MKIEYNNLYTHFIFTTLHRLPLITEQNRERIEKYITGLVNHRSCQMYAIYANPEHVHFLISRSPGINEEWIATQIEEISSKFIYENQLCIGRFEWQNTCAAFSISKGDIDRTCKYILNQKEHHQKKTFADEYEQFIRFYQHTLIPENKGKDTE
jgi:putative transposase